MFADLKISMLSGKSFSLVAALAHAGQEANSMPHTPFCLGTVRVDIYNNSADMQRQFPLHS